jgi:hypothetical protein
VYYKVERTWLTDRDGHSHQSTDRLPHMISSDSAQGAAMAFVSADHASLLGPIGQITGDKATATAIDGGRVYVVFVERASDSLGDPVRDSREGEPHSPGR